MPYVAEKPNIADDPTSLQTRIPGWGVDLDPKDRPAVPKERFNPGGTGAHWRFPERQVETYPRERSTEHKFLPPVFGTVCPPRGLSGRIRRYAYTFSEGRLAHWGLLVLGDRVDVLESRVIALLSGRPDNLLSEVGLRAEVRRHGLRSRLGRKRTDVVHEPLGAVLFLLPRLAIALGAANLVRAAVRRLTKPRARRRSLARTLLLQR